MQVLLLTRSPIPDAEQIVRQADMISALTLQRELLMHQAEEQRLKWASEKDGWERMVEALIAQQTKNRTASDRDDVSDHIQLSRIFWPAWEIMKARTLMYRSTDVPNCVFASGTGNRTTQQHT